MKQVTMRSVDFQHIKASSIRTPRGISPMLHHLWDFIARQGAWHGVPCIANLSAGGDKFPCLPISNRRALHQRRATFPRAKTPRLAAGMADLNRRHRTIGANQIRHALHAGDEGIIPKPGISQCAAAAPFHLGAFHHHHAGTTRGKAPSIHQMPIGDEATICSVLMHGRDHHAVLQRNATFGPGREKQRQGHGAILRTRSLGQGG